MMRAAVATRRAALALLAAPSLARAQEPYPSRPIRFIVAFPAGSATDLRARLFGERISADWGQPVVVDNRGGANGVVASEAVARARPDGYTMLFTANTTHVRVLGVTSRVHIGVLPDLPTVEEASGLAGYEMLTWNALYAPAGTPGEIVAKVNAKINEILARPDVAARLRDEAAIVTPGSPEDLGGFTAAEIEKWRRIVRDANIEVE
jgi:tripartite-type tricarboxylate transporter receptor subunit TctC